MKTLLVIIAYTWAIICMLLLPVTFIGMDFFSRQLSKMSFMKINPVYSGGETNINYQSDSLKITINKPVFAALFGSSSEGFVQVKFSGDKNIPAQITQDIDYDGDNNFDFNIDINTLSGDAKFKSYSKYARELTISSKVKDYWVIRVKVLNPSKNE